MKRYHLLLALLVTALAASACVKLGGKPLEKRYYQISPARTAQKADAPRDVILLVRRLSVSDLYSTRELVYRGAEGNVDSDFYNMYFVTPGSMLTTELRRWLSESGLFTHVIEPGSMVVPTLTLEGTVNALYGDYSTEQPAAVVEMQFFVVDESTADNAIVFSRSYTERVPLADAAPQNLIKGLTQGVEHIYANLETDLAAAPLKD
ncbi:ABC-type transport auxiliary lipoprotein family protein [uncultured Pseudodesulfovibrio sp.]|uniref:ABC-type transport auxiliary lipoprotein family protein n=1 Tax=uncultured Pseudodesulfovibrio sp. TaxID=2035858 RepID=UPI0029C96031|nr:ABC-type transport auxiliary lipoprotein family protein [uncultured Pseudodesulfovibrio sp.]